MLDNDKPMLNRRFFYISKEEMESYRAAFPSQSYQSIKGTLAIHQVVITPGSSNTVQYRNSSCACSACFNREYTKCECLQLYKDYPKPFQMINTTSLFRIRAELQMMMMMMMMMMVMMMMMKVSRI